MCQFSIQGRKVWFVVLHYPKSVSACKKKLHLSSYVFICLKNKQKADVIVLNKSLIEDLGSVIMNLT